MSAGTVLASALVEALRGIDGLSGVFRAAPDRAGLPHAVVETSAEADWSHKSGDGRELRVAVTVRDGGAGPQRSERIADAVEARLAGFAGAPDGWRLVSLVLVRRRALGSRAGGWSSQIEYRARLLAA